MRQQRIVPTEGKTLHAVTNPSPKRGKINDYVFSDKVQNLENQRQALLKKRKELDENLRNDLVGWTNQLISLLEKEVKKKKPQSKGKRKPKSN